MKTYTGIEYLKIDIANQFGLDKEQFDTRINWVNEHEKELETLYTKADDMFRYAAALMAYREAQRGIPIGHLVGLDACASGAQIMSTLMGDPIGAGNTGLTGDQRKDIYHEATVVMNELLGGNKTYDRKVIKPALMTHYYASKAEPKKAFGEDTTELKAFYKAQEIVAPGASNFLKIVMNCWQPKALEHSWVMPDGFVVKKKVTDMVDTKIEVDELDHATFMYRYKKNMCMEEGRSLPADIVQSIDGFIVRELCRRCNYDKTKLLKVKYMLNTRLLNVNKINISIPIEQTSINTGFTSIVGIENITEKTVYKYSNKYCYSLLTLIKNVLEKPPFPVICIHDEFKCHPNNMNYIRQEYINIFAEIAESTMLNSILSKVTNKEITITKRINNLGNLIRNSEYALS